MSEVFVCVIAAVMNHLTLSFFEPNIEFPKMVLRFKFKCHATSVPNESGCATLNIGVAFETKSCSMASSFIPHNSSMV